MDPYMIFWIGDLNYWIDNLDWIQVKNCFANGLLYGEAKR